MNEYTLPILIGLPAAAMLSYLIGPSGAVIVCVLYMIYLMWADRP